jgi:hypothetical protein
MKLIIRESKQPFISMEDLKEKIKTKVEEYKKNNINYEDFMIGRIEMFEQLSFYNDYFLKDGNFEETLYEDPFVIYKKIKEFKKLINSKDAFLKNYSFTFHDIKHEESSNIINMIRKRILKNLEILGENGFKKGIIFDVTINYNENEMIL